MNYTDFTHHTQCLINQIEDNKELIELLHKEFTRQHCPIKKGMIIEQAPQNSYARSRILVTKIFSTGQGRWKAVGPQMTLQNDRSKTRRGVYQIEFDSNFVNDLVTVVRE